MKPIDLDKREYNSVKSKLIDSFKNIYLLSRQVDGYLLTPFPVLKRSECGDMQGLDGILNSFDSSSKHIIETYFTSRDIESLITNCTIANRCSFLLGTNQVEREKIRIDFEKIYDIRSQIIHTGKLMTYKEEAYYVLRMEELLTNSINTEIKNYYNI